jgi:hypothetical protein
MVAENKNGKVVRKERDNLFGAEGKETASLIRRYAEHILININVRNLN